jgi:DNA-binding NarL/FixJ family response regulator
MNYLEKAIRNLSPGAEFVIRDNDLDNIEWHVVSGEAPSKNEILAEIEKVKQEEINAETQKITARESALAKLAALGLTETEIAALQNG